MMTLGDFIAKNPSHRCRRAAPSLVLLKRLTSSRGQAVTMSLSPLVSVCVCVLLSVLRKKNKKSLKEEVEKKERKKGRKEGRKQGNSPTLKNARQSEPREVQFRPHWKTFHDNFTLTQFPSRGWRSFVAPVRLGARESAADRLRSLGRNRSNSVIDHFPPRGNSNS